MKKLYSVINKEAFESLSLKKQAGIFKILYPNLVEDLRQEYLESTGQNKKTETKEAQSTFLKELGAKDKHLNEVIEDDFIKDIK